MLANIPSGWISSQDKAGLRILAPYSFFNAVAYVPPQVMFASTSAKPDQDGTKDSVANIRETEVFCVNIVEFAARDVMNRTSATLPREVDEFEAAGIEAAPCETIDCARVANAPASLDCKLTGIVVLPGEANKVVFGEVTGIHMRDDCLVDGMFDVTKFQPLTRLGYRDYSVIREVFSLARPDD